jgi:hypothetical protein
MGSGTPFRKRSLARRAGPGHTLYLMPETYYRLELVEGGFCERRLYFYKVRRPTRLRYLERRALGFLMPGIFAAGCAPATQKLLAYPGGDKGSPRPGRKEVLPSSGPSPSSVYCSVVFCL